MTETIETVPEPANPVAEPREGTGAWLLTRPTVTVSGWTLPDVHRVPETASILLGEDDGRCRVVREDGSRCQASRLRDWGVCSGHAGAGMQDYGKGSAMAARERQRRAHVRMTLGIGPRRSADPRAIARIRAIDRAEAIAAGLVDAPLDDPSVSTIERQRAIVTMLGETFPLASVSVTIEPETTEDVAGLGWRDLRALAASLTGAEEDH